MDEYLDEDYCIITILLCKKYDLPYNELAAQEACLSIYELKNKIKPLCIPEDKIEDAMLDALINNYKIYLAKMTN